ncbi:hypothetical protein PO909_007522 [Leuciscus waleckii]
MSSELNEDTGDMNEDDDDDDDDDEEEEEPKEKDDDDEINDDDDEGFSVLSDLPVEMSERRPTCRRCCRPVKVCLCPYLPALPLDVSTSLYIVQHPAEESRVLRTVPLLAACLAPGKCRVFVGRRFSEDRYPDLAAVYRDSSSLWDPDLAAVYRDSSSLWYPDLAAVYRDSSSLWYPDLAAVCRDSSSLLLYPGAAAESLEDLSFSSATHNVILIDGTWSQAKDMFLRNPLLQLPRQVQLRSATSSQYVIRTQPNNMCVSTLECAAVALAIMENNLSIQEVLLKPLQALCSFQLQHGAQIHHSKEHLIRSGQYNKIMPKNKRKIRRMQKLISNQNI